jgi:hypothetical protein
MFNLDHAITEWRGRLSAEGIKDRDLLDELESHLREVIDERLRSGSGERDAFDRAVQRIGEARVLKAEFDRAVINERKYMKKALIIAGGIIGVLIGMAFVMPAVAQYRNLGYMRDDEPWLFALGVVLTLGGFGAAFRGMKRRQA